MTWGAWQGHFRDRTQKSVKERSLTSLVQGCQCDRSRLGRWQKGGMENLIIQITIAQCISV